MLFLKPPHNDNGLDIEGEIWSEKWPPKIEIDTLQSGFESPILINFPTSSALWEDMEFHFFPDSSRSPVVSSRLFLPIQEDFGYP